LLDHFAAVEAVEQALGQPIGQVGLVAQGDIAVAPFNHRNGHRAIFNGLRGQVGLGDKVSSGMVKIGNARRHPLQLTQVELCAGSKAGHGQQFSFGVQTLACQFQGIDLNPRRARCGRCGHLPLLHLNDRGDFLEGWRGWNLLYLAAGAGRLCRKHPRAQCQ